MPSVIDVLLVQSHGWRFNTINSTERPRIHKDVVQSFVDQSTLNNSFKYIYVLRLVFRHREDRLQTRNGVYLRLALNYSNDLNH